jgi:MFS family permease
MDRNDRALTAFTMLGHATYHTYELVIPIFVVIWLDAFETTAAVFGLVVGASYALTGLGALPSGVLADRYSSKRLIVGCMLGMGVGFVLVSLAPNVVGLALGLLVWGGAASIYHPAGLSLISRGAKQRGTAFAYHGAAGNVGVATGPLLAAFLLVFFGWRVVAALLVVPVLVAIAVALRLDFDETAGTDADEAAVADGRGEIRDLSEFVARSKVLFTGGFVFVFLIGNLYGLYYRGAFTFLPNILAGVPMFDPVMVGNRAIRPSQYVYSGLLILGGAGQYVGGKLVDRVRAEYALVGTFGALVLIALVFVPAANAGLIPLLVVAGLLGFFVFMEAPINQEVISKYVPAEVRGLSFGYTYVAVFGIGALGSAVAGFVLTRASPAVLFVVLAAFAVTAALLGVYLLHRTR